MKQNYLGRPILSSYVNKLKFCFSENKHREKKKKEDTEGLDIQKQGKLHSQGKWKVPWGNGTFQL